MTSKVGNPRDPALLSMRREAQRGCELGSAQPKYLREHRLMLYHETCGVDRLRTILRDELTHTGPGIDP